MQTLSLGFFCFWMVSDFTEVLGTCQSVTFEDQLDQLKPRKPIKQLHAGFKYFYMKTFYCSAPMVGYYQKLVCGARCQIVQCWMVNLAILLNILFTYTIN